MYLIYLRKSRQDDERETIQEVLARHERQLQEYAIKTFGYAIPEENIYREVVSGETLEDRPEINKIFTRMQNEDILGVLVIEPSRLTRGDLLDCGTVVHIFRYTKTLIITPNKSYNLEDKYDRKFLEMELKTGNEYLEYIREVLQRGRNASAREGNFICSVAPYGYDRIKIGKSWTLTINETEAPFVRIAFQMYAAGNGAFSIANHLNSLGAKPRSSKLFNSTSIRQILENPVYIGKMRYKWKPTTKVYENGKLITKRHRDYNCDLIDGKHPAIIDEELYKQVQEQKGRVSREAPKLELANIYASLIKCKKCGRAIGLRRNRLVCTNAYHCHNISSNADIVNESIYKALKNSLDDFEIKASVDNSSVVKTHLDVLKQHEKDLEALEKKQEELYTFLEDGIYSREVFLMRNEKLAQDRERITEAIKKARENVPNVVDYKEKVLTLHKALDMIKDDSISIKEKNNFLKEVIEVIYYEKNKQVKYGDNGEDLIQLEIILK